MEKSKLIKILQTLSDSEMKEFGKFLEGNSYRKTGSAYTLYLYLKKNHPVFLPKKIAKEYVQQKLFKGSENKEKLLFNVMSQLTTALEDYLVKKVLEEDAIDKEFLILKAYKKRKLDKLFFQKINALEKSWEKKAIPGIEQLHNEYRLKKLCFLHPNYSLLNESPLDIPDLVECIDQYYFAIKLYWAACYATSRSFSSKADNEKNHYFVEEIIKLTAEPDFEKIPQIRLFRELTNAILSKEFGNYTDIKTVFFNCLELFDKCEKLDLINFLRYYCVSNYRGGVPNALQDLFELDSFAIDKGILLEDGYISVETYRNMVNLACTLNELEWVEDFINNYKDKIKEEEREDMVALCEARLAMCKKDFDKALQKLMLIKIQNAFYGFEIREIQLKCYYELEDYEEMFDNLTISFTKFLDRNKDLPEQMKKNLKKFISYTKKMKKETELKGIISEELSQKIKSDKEVACKSWLLETLEKSKVEITSVS